MSTPQLTVYDKNNYQDACIFQSALYNNCSNYDSNNIYYVIQNGQTAVQLFLPYTIS